MCIYFRSPVWSCWKELKLVIKELLKRAGSDFLIFKKRNYIASLHDPFLCHGQASKERNPLNFKEIHPFAPAGLLANLI